MLNRQLMFNHVVAALVKQGARSMAEVVPGEYGDPAELGCAYRGEGGLKCALGHCIPDARYKPNIENEGGANVRVMESIDSKFGVADQRRNYEEGAIGDPEFLARMQNDLHDSIEDHDDDPDGFRLELQEAAINFANHYDLKVDVNLFIVE